MKTKLYDRLRLARFVLIWVMVTAALIVTTLAILEKVLGEVSGNISFAVMSFSTPIALLLLSRWLKKELKKNRNRR